MASGDHLHRQYSNTECHNGLLGYLVQNIWLNTLPSENETNMMGHLYKMLYSLPFNSKIVWLMGIKNCLYGLFLSNMRREVQITDFCWSWQNTIYIRLLVTYLASRYALNFVMHIICVIYPEGKPTKTHLGLYQAVNWPFIWVKIGDFTRHITILHWHITEFDFCVTPLK